MPLKSSHWKNQNSRAGQESHESYTGNKNHAYYKNYLGHNKYKSYEQTRSKDENLSKKINKWENRIIFVIASSLCTTKS